MSHPLSNNPPGPDPRAEREEAAGSKRSSTQGTAVHAALPSHRRRLPTRQPTRALTVISLYLLTLAVAAGPVVLVFGTPLGWLLLAALACLLTVPVAITAPTTRPEQAATSDETVLRRPRHTS